MKLWLSTSLAGVLLSALFFYGTAFGRNDVPPLPASGFATPVKVLMLKGYSADEAPTFPGRVEAGGSAVLAFRVAGQLEELKVRMSDQVERGELLAVLDPVDYQLRVDARQAEFDLASIEAARADTLFEQQLISEDQHDTARTSLASARARLEQAREELSFCTLTAPFAGSIAFTYAMPSEVVAPQQPILNLQDTSTLDILFNLPPRYQPLLEGEDRASFSVVFQLLPGIQVPARYKEVSMQPDPDTSSYAITLAVDAPEGFSAREGMTVTVRLLHSSLLSSRWVLPAEALFERSEQQATVWRIDPETHTVHGARIEVDAARTLISGLNPGDQIVAAGVDRLREGQLVRRWVREGGL